MVKNIYLIGFMGTGKTTIALQLGQQLEYKVTDLDQEIEKKAGMCISQIFSEFGEAGFRHLESEMIRTCLKKEQHIIACGGGAVLKQKNVDSMRKSGIILLLTARPETILGRLKNDTTRPLLNGRMNKEYLEKMLLERSGFYEYAADVIISTDDKNPEELIKEIMNFLDDNRILEPMK